MCFFYQLGIGENDQGFGYIGVVGQFQVVLVGQLVVVIYVVEVVVLQCQLQVVGLQFDQGSFYGYYDYYQDGCCDQCYCQQVDVIMVLVWVGNVSFGVVVYGGVLVLLQLGVEGKGQQGWYQQQ